MDRDINDVDDRLYDENSGNDGNNQRSNDDDEDGNKKCCNDLDGHDGSGDEGQSDNEVLDTGNLSTFIKTEA